MQAVWICESPRAQLSGSANEVCGSSLRISSKSPQIPLSFDSPGSQFRSPSGPQHPSTPAPLLTPTAAHQAVAAQLFSPRDHDALSSPASHLINSLNSSAPPLASPLAAHSLGSSEFLDCFESEERGAEVATAEETQVECLRGAEPEMEGREESKSLRDLGSGPESAEADGVEESKELGAEEEKFHQFGAQSPEAEGAEESKEQGSELREVEELGEEHRGESEESGEFGDEDLGVEGFGPELPRADGVGESEGLETEHAQGLRSEELGESEAGDIQAEGTGESDGLVAEEPEGLGAEELRDLEAEGSQESKSLEEQEVEEFGVEGSEESEKLGAEEPEGLGAQELADLAAEELADSYLLNLNLDLGHHAQPLPFLDPQLLSPRFLGFPRGDHVHPSPCRPPAANPSRHLPSLSLDPSPYRSSAPYPLQSPQSSRPPGPDPGTLDSPAPQHNETDSPSTPRHQAWAPQEAATQAPRGAEESGALPSGGVRELDLSQTGGLGMYESLEAELGRQGAEGTELETIGTPEIQRTMGVKGRGRKRALQDSASHAPTPPTVLRDSALKFPRPHGTWGISPRSGLVVINPPKLTQPQHLNPTEEELKEKGLAPKKSKVVKKRDALAKQAKLLKAARAQGNAKEWPPACSDDGFATVSVMDLPVQTKSTLDLEGCILQVETDVDEDDPTFPCVCAFNQEGEMVQKIGRVGATFSISPRMNCDTFARGFLNIDGSKPRSLTQICVDLIPGTCHRMIPSHKGSATMMAETVMRFTFKAHTSLDLTDSQPDMTMKARGRRIARALAKFWQDSRPQISDPMLRSEADRWVRMLNGMTGT